MTPVATLEPSTVDSDPAPGPVLLTAREVQVRIIAASVREARDQGWCPEWDRLMRATFPNVPESQWLDSDGYDRQGYDREGRTPDGYDRDGYDRDGFTRGGYDRDGYDRQGYNHRGYNREGFDRNGYDQQGFNPAGVNRDGLARDSDEYRARFRYDRAGYDRDGFHGTDGTHYTTGETREEYDRRRADDAEFRFDRNGYDREGLTHAGRNVRNVAPDRYDTTYAYNVDGYNAAGLNRYGERR